MSFHIEMGEAPALEVGFIARQRMFQELKARSSLYILAAQLQVHISIGQHLVIAVLGANLVIILGEEDVALDATAERYL